MATVGQFNELVNQLSGTGADALGCGYSSGPVAEGEDELTAELLGDINMQARFTTQEALDAAQALVNSFAEDSELTVSTNFTLM